MRNKKTALLSAIFAVSLSLCACSQKEKKSVANPIQFQKFSLDKEFKGDSLTPSIAVSLKLEYPIEYKDPSVLKSIQTSVIQSVLGEKAQNNPQCEMEKMAENIINEHKTRVSELRNNPLLEDGDCISDTYHQTIQEVTFNQDGLLTIQTTDSSHYGGAKGIKFLYYNNFDLRTGKDLQYNDLFIEDSEDMISSFITQKLMADNHLEKAEELEEFGFMDIAEIKPVNNFSLSEKGITFVYNPSEIACLALGIVKVFLPYENLALLIKEDAPIGHLTE